MLKKKELLINKEILKKYKTEQLVLIIQSIEKGNIKCSEYQKSLYWDTLYERTEKVIWQVFHKYVNNYYKQNYAEDVMTILKTGWIKAIYKYNYEKDKTKSCFVPFAQTIMYQDFITTFVRYHTEERNGKSVNYILINDVKIPRMNGDDGIMTNNLKTSTAAKIETDEKAEKALEDVNIKLFIKDKMDLLKKYHPEKYNAIVEHIVNEKTQKEIAENFGKGRNRISKDVQEGLSFLRLITEKEELYI